VFAVLAVFAGLGRAQSTFQGYLRVKYFFIKIIYYYGRQRRPFWAILSRNHRVKKVKKEEEGGVFFPFGCTMHVRLFNSVL
jgi:hypothetical protein